MADNPHHLAARDARDRLIDLLGFGLTSPLRDLTVTPRSQRVPSGVPARIVLEDTQAGVRYELLDAHDRPVTQSTSRGGKLALVTPPVEGDVAYRIRATKVEPSGSAERPAFLHARPQVRVGIDGWLATRLLDLPLADGAWRAPAGAPVRVEIERSQEGVLYQLVDAADPSVALSDPLPGNLGTLVLTSVPLRADVDLRVRAERRGSEPSLLDGILPVRIRAAADE